MERFEMGRWGFAGILVRRPGFWSSPFAGRAGETGVVSVAGKGPLSAGEVGGEKTNVREPLLTHR